MTDENIFKFILKFYFLFEVSSPAIFPPMKISKIPEMFQFLPDFVEFKNPVPPPSQTGEATMREYRKTLYILRLSDQGCCQIWFLFLCMVESLINLLD